MRDPVHDVEIRHGDLGMKRRLQIFCTENAHNGNRGGQGYPIEMWYTQMDHFCMVSHCSSIYFSGSLVDSIFSRSVHLVILGV